jgi:hypothetical protein
MEHTVLENVKLTGFGVGTPLSVTGASPALSTSGGRANAVAVDLGVFAFTVDDFLVVFVEESDTGDFAGEENTVLNGGNQGTEVCVMIGRTLGADIYRHANGLPLDAITIDGEEDPNHSDNALVGGDTYIVEYLGSKKFYRVVAEVTGTVAVPFCLFAVQAGLRVLPNIVDAG